MLATANAGQALLAGEKLMSDDSGTLTTSKMRHRIQRRFGRATLRGKLRQLRYTYSRDELANLLGITAKVIDSIFTDSLYVPHEQTERSISTAFDDINPRHPFPDYLLCAREELLAAKSDPGSPTLKKTLIKLDGFLTRHKSDSAFDDICASGLHVLVLFSKAFHNGTLARWFPQKECVTRAEQIIDAALKKATLASNCAQANGDISLTTGIRYEVLRLHMNKIAVMTAASNRKIGLSFADLEKTLLSDRSIEKILEFSQMQEHAYLWQAPYNGLEISELLNRQIDADQFYDLLIEVDPGFQDPDYDPGEVPPLRSPRSPEAIRAFCARKFGRAN